LRAFIALKEEPGCNWVDLVPIYVKHEQSLLLYPQLVCPTDIWRARVSSHYAVCGAVACLVMTMFLFSGCSFNRVLMTAIEADFSIAVWKSG
jgi:hypothetical protein